MPAINLTISLDAVDLLTSQIPVTNWHAQIGDPTIADSILDRLVHNAHRLELEGESMRKNRGAKGGKHSA